MTGLKSHQVLALVCDPALPALLITITRALTTLLHIKGAPRHDKCQIARGGGSHRLVSALHLTKD